MTTTVRNRLYGNIYTGERAGSATAVQLADRSCEMVMFVAPNSNTGDVYIGTSGVTKAAGTTTTTAGYELQPGAQTPWIPVRNLNQFYIISDSTADDILWMAVE